MRFVELLLIEIRLVFAGTHSLQYFCTVVSGGINIPEFTAVGMVDDQQFMYFDTKTIKAVPKTEWMRQNLETDHWDLQTQIVIGHYLEYKNNMHNIIDLYNHSMSGVHTFQITCGCELDASRTTQGYYRFGYDGKDFISFDKNTLSWIAAKPQADKIKNKWKANRVKSESWKTYLENTCTESLKKLVRYGKDSLERKDAPNVSLWQNDPWSPPSVVCHATGFYPSNITITWKKNHIENHSKDVKVSDTLPNADGTYQKRISLSVKPEEWKKNPDEYRCVIQHVGAEKEIVVLLNENNIKSNSGSDNIVHIALWCLVSLAIFTAIMGLIVWRKFRNGEFSILNSRGDVNGSTTDDSQSDNQEQPESEVVPLSNSKAIVIKKVP